MKTEKIKQCIHEYRQITDNTFGSKSQAYDFTPIRNWYQFYCIHCLYVNLIMKKDRNKLTD